MGDHLRRMAVIKDGVSDTGDAPDVEMKEGPGPCARDPARRAPAPIRGQGTEKGRGQRGVIAAHQFRLCRGTVTA